AHPTHGDTQRQGDININIFLSGINLSGSVGNIGGFRIPNQPGTTTVGGGNLGAGGNTQQQSAPAIRGMPLAGNQPNAGAGQQVANGFRSGQAGILGRSPTGNQQGGLVLPRQGNLPGGIQPLQGQGGKGNEHHARGGDHHGHGNNGNDH